MSLLRQSASQEITVEKPMAEVFAAFQKAGDNVGTVRDPRPAMGTMTIFTGMTLFPPQNPAHVRLSFESVAETRTKVRFAAGALDGAVGLGSATGAFDRIITSADAALAGRPLPQGSKGAGMILFLILAAALAAGLVAFFLTRPNM